MSNIIKILKDSYSENILHVNPEKLEELNLKNEKNLYLSFGSKKQPIELKIDGTINKNEIILSKKIIDALHLPSYINYEIVKKDNEIKLGPCIGILLRKHEASINDNILRSSLLYTMDYASLHGAIIIFALDGIDKVNKKIHGFCYNPNTDSFEEGTFPYPNSIYRRISYSSLWRNHFIDVIGNSIYNSYYFDKLETYNYLSEYPEMKEHLPATTLYTSPKDVFNFLLKYKKIFVKPISGMQGNRITKIEFLDDKFIFKSRKDQSNTENSFNNVYAAEMFIRDTFEPSKYLIQENIDLLRYEDSIIDFRVIMQKNENALWKCNGIIARIGEKNSIVSNISNSGKALFMEDLFRKNFHWSEKQIYLYREKIVSLSLNICSCLDKCNLVLGTVGLDIAVDKNNNLWLIEINNRDPDPTIALDVKDRVLYYKIKSSILLYGKNLAGF